MQGGHEQAEGRQPITHTFLATLDMHDLFKILIYNTRHFKEARNKQGNDSASILLFLSTLRCFLCAFHRDLVHLHWGKILKNQAYLQSLY